MCAPPELLTAFCIHHRLVEKSQMAVVEHVRLDNSLKLRIGNGCSNHKNTWELPSSTNDPSSPELAHADAHFAHSARGSCIGRPEPNDTQWNGKVCR